MKDGEVEPPHLGHVWFRYAAEVLLSSVGDFHWYEKPQRDEKKVKVMTRGARIQKRRKGRGNMAKRLEDKNGKLQKLEPGYIERYEEQTGFKPHIPVMPPCGETVSTVNTYSEKQS